MKTSFKIKPQVAVDSYKLNHKAMYPEGTTKIYSNMTPRSGKIIEKIIPYQVYDGKVVHFGLQGLVKHLVGLFQENFFDLPVKQAISEYSNTIGPFTGQMLDASGMIALHQLGYLPIEIRGLQEGSVVPYKIPVFTIKNTHPNFAWLTNYLETYFSNEYWKTATTATIARYYRKMFEHFAEKTGVGSEFVDWQGHDFSCRGMSGMMDSATAGSGHLTSFLGSDTVIASDYLKYAYKAENTFIAASVPATEHSVSSANIMYNMQSLGVDRSEAEYLFFVDYITKIVPSGIASYVADTYDYWQVITEVAPKAKELILNRKEDSLGNSKVVFRPDTGDPVKVVCGYDYLNMDVPEFESKYGGVEYEFILNCWSGEEVVKKQGKFYKLKVQCQHTVMTDYTIEEELPEYEVKGSIECLWDTFGGTVNKKGYKVLNPKVGLIYGDSITPQRAWQILDQLEKKGFATSCVVFGIGSFTYQYITRDTLGFAIKATYLECNGKKIDLYKDPKTGDDLKKSAKGLLQVISSKQYGYTLFDQVPEAREQTGELELIWSHGSFKKETDLVEVRKNVKSSL